MSVDLLSSDRLVSVDPLSCGSHQARPISDESELRFEAVTGRASNTPLVGPVVELKLVVKETGKLSDSFVVLMRLQPDAE